MLSERAILEFQQLYRKKFGEDIAFNKAKEEALKLLKLFQLIFKPINHEKNES